jgi:hypothetical protein
MSTVASKTVNNAYVLYDKDYKNRILDAWGENVTKKILQSSYAPVSSLPAEWAVTTTGSTPTVVNGTSAGTLILGTVTTAEYSGFNMQCLGTAYAFTSTKPVYFGIKLTIGGTGSPATDADLLAGLCLIKTDLLATSSAHEVTATGVEGAFLHKVSESTTATVKTYVSGSLTNEASYGTALTTTAFVFEMYYDGVALYSYIDDNLVGTFTSSLPTVAVTPSINYRAGDAGVANTLTVNWMRCIRLG